MGDAHLPRAADLGVRHPLASEIVFLSPDLDLVFLEPLTHELSISMG
jgi:hypothetical protein